MIRSGPSSAALPATVAHGHKLGLLQLWYNPAWLVPIRQPVSPTTATLLIFHTGTGRCSPLSTMLSTPSYVGKFAEQTYRRIIDTLR